MKLSNSEREMLWVAGWNDLDDWMSRLAPVYLVDESWREASVDELQGFIQQAAYEREERVAFRETFHKGNRAVQYFFEPASHG